jgi:hypothetical protein
MGNDDEAVAQGIRAGLLHRQLQEILTHKWIVSEQAGRDLGNDAVRDWIEKYAGAFRAYWEQRLADIVDNEQDDSGEHQDPTA